MIYTEMLKSQGHRSKILTLMTAGFALVIYLMPWKWQELKNNIATLPASDRRKEGETI